MESFTKGEVIIYEGHMEDILCVFDNLEEDSICWINNLNGNFFRSTTLDRIRKASREDLTNKILQLESSLTTLRGAMKNYRRSNG